MLLNMKSERTPPAARIDPVIALRCE